MSGLREKYELPDDNTPAHLFKALGLGEPNCIETHIQFCLGTEQLTEKHFPLKDKSIITMIRGSRYSLCLRISESNSGIVVFKGNFAQINQSDVSSYKPNLDQLRNLFTAKQRKSQNFYDAGHPRVIFLSNLLSYTDAICFRSKEAPNEIFEASGTDTGSIAGAIHMYCEGKNPITINGLEQLLNHFGHKLNEIHHLVPGLD